MLNIIEINSKKTRAFGWIQDSGNLDALCNVVAIFDETSGFHTLLKTRIIPDLVKDKNNKNEMLKALESRPVALNYKMLTGGHATPRSASLCDGIVQAAVKGQKRDYIGDWPADNFIRWAQAFGFIDYNYSEDTFLITEAGKNLVKASTENERKELLINAAISYPPAYRIMSLLKKSGTILTKFEIGKKLGFTGEDGFISYPLSSIVAAMASTTSLSERSKIRSDWESSSDKYARTIAQWLVSLGLLENASKEIEVQYGNRMVSDTLGGFTITPMGERYFRNCSGNSRHGKVHKIVSYEMFAAKGKDREYLRYRRSLILKYFADKNRKCTYEEVCKFLTAYGLNEIQETIYDDVSGFVNLGIDFSVGEKYAEFKDSIINFPIPHYKNLTEKSELSTEKEIVRAKLKNISHEYLSLMDLAFDSSQNRLFEMKVMELFLHECNFNGEHFGGASKPDGVLYTNKPDSHYGVIIDMKAYSKGYTLPIGQRDEMLRYIRENQLRDAKQNSNEWWRIFPEQTNEFYFMFISGLFKGDMTEKISKISIVNGVKGTAMPIVTALLVADKMKGKEINDFNFKNGICNTEYQLR
jgi:hypothetical protein